jgi:hypothetical protein
MGDLKTRVSTPIHVLTLSTAKSVPEGILVNCYFCGIESLRLRGRRPRVTEMAHDKDKDWRKDPKLYD